MAARKKTQQPQKADGLTTFGPVKGFADDDPTAETDVLDELDEPGDDVEESGPAPLTESPVSVTSPRALFLAVATRVNGRMTNVVDAQAGNDIQFFAEPFPHYIVTSKDGSMISVPFTQCTQMLKGRVR